MKNKNTFKYIFFLLFLFPGALFSQKQDEVLNKELDSIFFDAVTRVAPADIDKAHQIADSLYRFSESDLYKIRALLLSSWFYNTSGLSEKSVRTALEAEKLAVRTRNYDWQVRILGFLSAEFQNIGLLKEREELLKRMKNTIPRVKDREERALLYPMYYQERVLYYLENKEDEKVWEYLNLAKKYMNKLPDSKGKYMLLSVNERVYGLAFLRLSKQPDSALVHFDKSVFYSDQARAPDYEKEFLYSGLGQAYLMKKQDSLGLDYLRKAEALTRSSNNVRLKLEVYTVLSDYYKKKADTDNYIFYLEKYRELYEEVQSNKVRPVELLLESLKKENRTLRYSRIALLVLLTVLTTGIILSFIRYRNKKKKDYQIFREIIDQLKETGKTISKDPIPSQIRFDIPVKENEEPKAEKLRISEETEQKIIEGLKSFESGTNFLNANFALADLASQVGVNTKYLSHTLKRHYGKDFSTYINELRINYIIDKLQTHKEYHLYKLSFLAKECGFSSHSKFSAVFKSVTGLTPTKFINYLKKKAV